jgi:hypothetical protein
MSLFGLTPFSVQRHLSKCGTHPFFRSSSETINLYVLFTCELARIPADDLTPWVFLRIANEFYVEPHALLGVAMCGSSPPVKAA